MKVVSIDQNSHCLWDTLPKLDVLARRGNLETTHFVEDIDVAFTDLGSSEGETLRIAPERFYHTGGSDWGAALFYTDFLGRVPVEIRSWEKFLGLKLKQLARLTDTDIAGLYDKYSVSDNWMLIGPSFVDGREHHRLIGDLGVAECREFMEWIFAHAREDVLARFPAAECIGRANRWFDFQQQRMTELLDVCCDKNLAEFYAAWLGRDVEQIQLQQCSDIFSLKDGAPPLADFFVDDYDRAAELYNRAIDLADIGLHRLDVAVGELPFYVIKNLDGRYVRCECFLRGGKVVAGGEEFARAGGWPVEAMAESDVEAVAGKAVVLVIQARLIAGALALPYHGSLYMPAVHEFEKLLKAEGLLEADISPVLRVRFRLLERMAELGDDVAVNLPEHLRGAFGTDELPANRFASQLGEIVSAARERLKMFENAIGRENWQRAEHHDLIAEMESLDAARRQLARKDPKGEAIRELSMQHKALQIKLVKAMLEQVHLDYQTSEIDFYDSRGAILPWCIAMGGEKFYEYVIENAEIYTETP